MFAIKKILCPTDLSESSYRVFDLGNEMALNLCAELILLTVIVPDPNIMGLEGFNINITGYLQEIKVSTFNLLLEMKKKFLSGKVKSRSIVSLGRPADQILRAANYENVDIILIARRKLIGWRRLIFGSVSESVV